MNNAITGGHQESVTSQALQTTGMSQNIATLVDSGLSLGGSILGLGALSISKVKGFQDFWLREIYSSRPASFAKKDSPLPVQMHHFATNKSQTFTPRIKTIVEEYGLDLNGAWNKELMHHLGRHPDKYHLFVLRGMKQAKKEADKCYDAKRVRTVVLKNKTIPLIPHRQGSKVEKGLCYLEKYRWKVERTIAWIKTKYRRISTRWERKMKYWEGFLCFALIGLWMKFLVQNIF